jgi:hypothetical protein
LRKWLAAQTNPQVRLKVLVVPDPASFGASDQRFVDFTIDRTAIDRYFGQSAAPARPADAMADLQRNAAPDYRFGSLADGELLTLRTKDYQGLGFLTVSFWSGMTPIDSMVMPVCVSDSDASDACGTVTAPVVSVSNTDRRNVGAPDPVAETWAASLHLIEVPTYTVAVLQTRDADSAPITWQLDGTLSDLASTVGSLLNNFSTATNDQSIRDTGGALFNAVFPPGASRAKPARAAIQNMLAGRKIQARQSIPPLIWVRVDPQNPEKIFSVPMAIAAVDGELLGDWFRVQSTLPRQDYRTLDACISRWMKLLPPSAPDSEFADAQDFINKRVKGGVDDYQNNLHTFTNWLMAETPAVMEPAVLFMLNHYYEGGIGFNQRDWVAPTSIVRPFLRPSVAIIEGCEGAHPYRDAFIQGLNRAGIQAIITTNGPIKPLMAGQYFDSLNAVLDGNPSYDFSLAHFKAVQALKGEKRNKLDAASYGLFAHVFTLLGDGSVKVCSLPKLQ